MRSSSINVLHSIDDEGIVKEVPFLDENGTAVPSVHVKYILNVNDAYISMQYSQGISVDIVLINKLNGQVHSLGSAGSPSIWPDEETPNIYADKDYLYFVATDGYLKKVDLKLMNARNMNIDRDNGKVLTQQPFLADEDGNVAYNAAATRFRTA